MTRDPVRDLIQSSLPPVTDRQEARARIVQQVEQHRRRDRRRTAVVAVAGAAALAFALYVLVPDGTNDGLPVVGQSPSPTDPTEPTESTQGSEGTVVPTCGTPQVDDRIIDFLTEWGDGVVQGDDDDEVCVVAGLPGPAPRFDTSALGAQIPLDPTETTDGVDPYGATPDFMVDEVVPAVHVGRIGQSNEHAFITWQRSPQGGSLNVCLEGGCFDGPEIPPEGVTIGQGGQQDTVVVRTWVAPEVAVVAVALDGQPAGWQQPVARAAVLLTDAAPRDVQEVTLTTFDADGNVLSRDAYPSVT